MVEAAAALGVEAERLPLGVALDRWPPSAPRPRATAHPLRLLHVASLNPVKDQETLLQAARLLLDASHPFRLDVVGEDTMEGRVQTRASQLGLERVVHFHGFLPQDKLRPLVEAADIHLVSSRHEADPTVLLEAAVAGVPTVGTRVGHLLDWAPDAALAVPPGSPAALAEGVLQLALDEPRRMALARAAQRRAVAEDADWTAARVVSIYEEMLEARRRREPGRASTGGSAAVREPGRGSTGSAAVRGTGSPEDSP
jgi:glycosyltransferase involved in cell wall biosynthesis